MLGAKARFHGEKDALLLIALAHSSAVSVDDAGTRHQGNNAYVTQIGNDCFAWFQTTGKSRINFLQLLRAQYTDYRINAQALAYMRQQRLPQQPLQRLLAHPCQHFPAQEQWEKHLKGLGIVKERHRRIATEGALLGSVLVRGQIWSLYADVKAYKDQPTATAKVELQAHDRAGFSHEPAIPGIRDWKQVGTMPSAPSAFTLQPSENKGIFGQKKSHFFCHILFFPLRLHSKFSKQPGFALSFRRLSSIEDGQSQTCVNWIEREET